MNNEFSLGTSIKYSQYPSKFIGSKLKPTGMNRNCWERRKTLVQKKK